jgi:hypothetical protein
MKKQVSQEIMEYIKKQNSFSIPQLQIEFSLNYYEAHRIVDALLEEKSIEFCNGIEYKFVEKESIPQDFFGRQRGFSPFYEELRRRREEAEKEQRKKEQREEVDEDTDIGLEDMKADNDAAEDLFTRIEPKAMRKQVLKYCIDQGRASISMIQTEFHLGFIKACEMVKWMESKGYVSANSIGEREILISEAEFDRIYGTDSKSQTIEEAREEHIRRIRESFSRVLDEDEDNDEEAEDDEEENSDLESEECDDEELIGGDQDLSCVQITEERVTDFLHKLIKSDQAMTRNGAIKKVEAYMEQARSKNFFNRLNFLKKTMERLVALSDYKYKKLRQQLCSDTDE